MARPYRVSHEDMVKAHRLIEFALESLKLVSLFKSVTLDSERNEIESLHKNLQFLQDFINLGLESSSQRALFSKLVVEILEAADELLVVTDSGFNSNLSDTSRFLRYSPRVADLVQKIGGASGNILYSSRISDVVRHSREIPFCADQRTAPRLVVTRNGYPNWSRQSSRIADVVRHIREIPFCACQRTPRLVVTRNGFCGDLLAMGMRDFRRKSPRVSDLVQQIISLLGTDFYSGIRLVVTDSGHYCCIRDAYPLFVYSPIVADFVQRITFSEEKDNIFPVKGAILIADEFGNFCNVSDFMFFLRFSRRIFRLVQGISSIGKEIDAGPKGEGILMLQDSGFYNRLVSIQGFGFNDSQSVVQLCSFKGAILVVNCTVFNRNIQAERRRIRSTEKRIPDGPNIEGGSSSSESSSSQQGTSVVVEKIVFGFEEETTELRNRLVRGSKLLQVIPITGMAGIGKTTLAGKLYNDLSITYHFHIRAWLSISQVYGKRKSLHSILSSILNENDPVLSTEDIGEKLYKCLKGNRYLIVMDDIWDIHAWNELKIYFPDDENGSRILMTSRVVDEVAKASPGSPPHLLRFFTREESYDLFKRKVFADKSFPEELVQIGEKIVAKCKGLPLAIVVVAGLLSQREKTSDWWRQVADRLGSSVNSDLEQIMDILALSYTHLSPQLKSCFLYLGSFPEDYEIPVKGLIRSWIAEGFVEHCNREVLENVAENYLINLINRSLVTVGKKSSVGGIKSCHLHDVLREFCLKKASEKKFLQLICRCEPNPTPLLKPELDHSTDNPYQVQSFSDCQYFHFYKGRYVTQHRVSNPETLAVYRLLKALDLRHIMLDKFPEKILELVHLRLLALWIDRYQNLPQAIFKLWNLETFILDGDKAGRIELPNQILKMVRLRHVEISKELLCHEMYWGTAEIIPSSVLENLQVLSQVCPSGSFLVLLSKTPHLRKLGLHLTFSEKENPSFFPDLPYLDKLETLRFEYQTLGMVPFHIPQSLPPSLKKLTLVGSHVRWEEISIIGLLPNLEVLKIKDNFFSGSKWETSENGFCSLKFLKLSHLDLQEWISDSSHFPKLEHLVLNGCLDLQEIPFDIEEIATLHTIEVYRSSSSTVEWAKEIQENQGHAKVLIYQHFKEF